MKPSLRAIAGSAAAWRIPARRIELSRLDALIEEAEAIARDQQVLIAELRKLRGKEPS